MPRLDGTGPEGKGSVTGRGFGKCQGADIAAETGVDFKRGRRGGFFFGKAHGGGRGCRRSFFFAGGETQKEMLENERRVLKNRLAVVDQALSDPTE